MFLEVRVKIVLVEKWVIEELRFKVVVVEVKVVVNEEKGKEIVWDLK